MAVRIGVDYDGVVADTHGLTIDLVREQYGVELTPDDIVWENGRPALAGDLQHPGGGVEEFVANPDYIDQLQPVHGARDALTRLSERLQCDLYLVTHRPPSVHDAIERWLERNDFPQLEVPASIPRDKAEVAPPLDVLIDDYHGHADSAARAGLLGVQLTAAWESGEPAHNRTVTASTWEEAVTAIREYVNQ